MKVMSRVACFQRAGVRRDRRISKLGEVDFQLVIGNADGLFEIRNSFADLHIDPAVEADESVQAILIDDLAREEIQSDFHVLLLVHGDAIVEIFDDNFH